MRFIPFASPSYEKKRRKVNQPALEILATSGCPPASMGAGPAPAQAGRHNFRRSAKAIRKCAESAKGGDRFGFIQLAPGPGGRLQLYELGHRDGKHLWGRNFDFDRIARGTAVTCLPAGTPYFPGGQEGGGSQLRSRYAAVGTGILLIPGTPVLYEGINERGLMGGQLYYREFARFPDQARPGTLALCPPFAVLHLLGQCAQRGGGRPGASVRGDPGRPAGAGDGAAPPLGLLPTRPGRWLWWSPTGTACTSTAAPWG